MLPDSTCVRIDIDVIPGNASEPETISLEKVYTFSRDLKMLP